MIEFLRVLALYYACDEAAAARPMAATDVTACMAHYGAVKSHFSEPDESNAVAFLRFKTWEANNPELVEGIRKNRI